jgi:outer membrane protein OmpA-like peptidoglycan-associated protein
MKRAILGIFFAAVVAPLMAGDATGRIAIGGAGGWADLLARKENKRSTHGDMFGSAWLRLGLTKKNELIFNYDSLQFKVKNDSSANRNRIRPITAGLWRSLWTDKNWTPIVTLGVGGGELQWQEGAGQESHSAFVTQGGVGLEYFPSRMVSVGTLARLHYAVNSSNGDRTELTTYTLGLMANVFWGGPEPTRETVVPPAPVEEPVVVLPPADTDGDGVLDSMDQCPRTPPGAIVNDAGCSVEKVSVSLNVKFATGKVEVDSRDDAQFQKVAGFMKKYPDTVIVVEGHSDSVGLPAKNKRLSEQRANAVRTVLVEKFQVAPERVTAKGFGMDYPIASNATPEGRVANRRVVAVISAAVKK